jgi:hypothetical protein
LPLIVVEPARRADHFELVVAQDRPGANKPIRPVLDRHHEQVDPPNGLVQDAARIAADTLSRALTVLVRTWQWPFATRERPW